MRTRIDLQQIEVALHSIARTRNDWIGLTLGAEENTVVGTTLESLVKLSGKGSLANVGDARVVGQKVLLDSLTAVEEKIRSVRKFKEVTCQSSSATRTCNDGDDEGSDFITYLDPPRSLSYSGEHVSTKFQTIRTLRAGAIVTPNPPCRNPSDGRAGIPSLVVAPSVSH